MALVLPTRDQPDWDVTLNAALLYLESIAGGGGGGAVIDVNGQTGHVVISAVGLGALVAASNLSDLNNPVTARTNLGLGGAAVLSVGTTTGTVMAGDDSRVTGAAQKSANLSDLANAVTARTNLGLGGAAVLNVGTTTGTVAAGDDSRITGAQQTSAKGAANGYASLDGTTKVPIAQIPTGTTSTTVALGNDSRIVGAAPLASPAFTGTPTAPTATAGTNTTQLATTAFVGTAVASVGAPASVFDITSAAYGAKGDGQIFFDGNITASSTTLTATSSAPFVVSGANSSLNKWVMIHGASSAGQTSHIAQITAVNSTSSVTISVAAVTTVSNVRVLMATDDTAAIQAAINAAYAYATLHGNATIKTPTAPAGYFYGIAGALVTAHSGNSQLYIPLTATTLNKVGLNFIGDGNGSLVQHWQQLQPQFSGSTWVSFGVFSNTTNQGNAINNNGNPCVIGGPSQPGGYGISPGVFTNTCATFNNMSILTTYSHDGLTYSAGDMSGLANCDVTNFAYGATGTVAGGDFTSGSSFGAGASIGWLMPANGNNDNCIADNITCHGGYTYGFLATEHTVTGAMRILYCWAGWCPVGVYFGGVGATHGFVAAQLSIEACTNLICIFGGGSAGIGPFINITQLDTESGAPTFTDRNSGGALASALGTIRLTGLYTVANVTTTGPTGLKIINGQNPYPVTSVSGTYSVNITDEAILANAGSAAVTVNLLSALNSGSAITVKKTDGTSNPVNIVCQAGQTIDGLSTYVINTPNASRTFIPSGGKYYVI